MISEAEREELRAQRNYALDELAKSLGVIDALKRQIQALTEQISKPQEHDKVDEA